MRRTDGNNYSPKTIYQILCDLLRYSRVNQPDPVNFLDRQDSRIKKLHATCDVIFQALHDQGIVVEKRSTPVVSQDNEEKPGILNTCTSISLQRAGFIT